jgi:hypothetical protein
MIEKTNDHRTDEKLGDQKRERHSAPELWQILHDLMNQLTIMNFCCSKFRAAAKNAFDQSVTADIDRIERTIVDMTSLLGKISEAVSSTPVDSSSAGIHRAKANQSVSQPVNVYSLFKRRRRRQ